MPAGVGISMSVSGVDFSKRASVANHSFHTPGSARRTVTRPRQSETRCPRLSLIRGQHFTVHVESEKRCASLRGAPFNLRGRGIFLK